MRPQDDGAYAYLLGLYLGDGCISTHARGVYKLRIVLDVRYPTIIAECRAAMAAVKPPGRTEPGTVHREGCDEIYSFWKHWPCLFPQHGPGKKHERSISLEPCQEEIVRKRPDRFLRGLIQSDGWRGENKVTRLVGGKRKVYWYPRYQFTNHSADIRRLFAWACDLFGVECRTMTWKVLAVSRREDVSKLDSVIGPKC